MPREKHKWKPHQCQSTDAVHRDGATRSSDEDSVMGLERRGSIVQLELKKTTGNGRIGLKQAKPFCITKRQVWEAYKRVKANKRAAGVEGQTIEKFAENLQDNLYKLWKSNLRQLLSTAGATGRDTEKRRWNKAFWHSHSG
jgi:RNA-directed DNA polymerase